MIEPVGSYVRADWVLHRSRVVAMRFTSPRGIIALSEAVSIGCMIKEDSGIDIWRSQGAVKCAVLESLGCLRGRRS